MALEGYITLKVRHVLYYFGIDKNINNSIIIRRRTKYGIWDVCF